VFPNIRAAEALGYRKAIPPFLDPNLKPEDLQYGVSFASAATGFDDYTAEVSVHTFYMTLCYATYILIK